MTTEPIDGSTEVQTAEEAEPLRPEEDSQDEPLRPDEDDTNPNAEAARYRTRLREAEAANAVLSDQVVALQRQIVESQCAVAGTKPLSLWSVTELADLLNEDGTVAPERVQEAIRTAEESLGHPARPVRRA